MVQTPTEQGQSFRHSNLDVLGTVVTARWVSSRTLLPAPGEQVLCARRWVASVALMSFRCESRSNRSITTVYEPSVAGRAACGVRRVVAYVASCGTLRPCNLEVGHVGGVPMPAHGLWRAQRSATARTGEGVDRSKTMPRWPAWVAAAWQRAHTFHPCKCLVCVVEWWS